jgi:hypothetical protein
LQRDSNKFPQTVEGKKAMRQTVRRSRRSSVNIKWEGSQARGEREESQDRRAEKTNKDKPIKTNARSPQGKN